MKARFLGLMVLILCLLTLSPGSSVAAPSAQDLRHWEQLLFLSPGSIHDLAYSPDGTLLAVAGVGGVRLCTPDLAITDVMPAAGDTLAQVVAWSPDGTQLVTGERLLSSADGTHIPAMHIWDVASSQPIGSMGKLEQTGDSVQAIAWSPDGQWIAAGFREKVEIWPAGSRYRDRMLLYAGTVTSLAWSPDGSQLAAPGVIWDTTTWEHRAEFDSTDVIRWAPDGTRLAVGGADHTLGIWDAATLERQITLSGHTDSINALTWSPDGTQLASGSDDGTVRVWDALTGDTIATLSQDNAVLAVAWSPDKRHMVAGIAGSTPLDAPDVMVTAWDATTFGPVDRLHAAGYTESVMWAPDGIRLASAEGSMVKIWNGHTGELLRVLDGYETHTFQVRWSPDGTLLAVQGNADSPVWIWDTTSGERLATFGEYGQPSAYAMGSWSPDSTRYAHGQPDGSIAIFDAMSGEPLMSLSEQDLTYPDDIEWSPDGTRLAAIAYTRDSSSILIWDTTTGQLLDELSGDGSVRWSPDGARLAYHYEDMLNLYDVDTEAQMIIDTDFSIVAWSPDGQYIATWRNADCGMQDQVQIWDTHSGERLAVLDGGEEAWIDFAQWSLYGISRSTCGGARYIAYAPDGTRWAIGYGFGIEVWKHGED